MKKILLTLAAVVMTMVVSISAYADDMMYGDVNNDVTVNAQDALAVLKHAAKISLLDEKAQVLADVTDDKNVDAQDALDILKYAAHIIDSFKVEDNAEATDVPTPATTKPAITPIPTEPMESIGPGVWPTMIPLPVVSADPANYVEGTLVEVSSLNGAVDENGVYTFTDENAANKKGIIFKSPFAGKNELVESFEKAFEGQEINLTETQRTVYDPEAVYPTPVWNTGVSLSFWAKYEWDNKSVSNEEPILVMHRNKGNSNDFAVSLCLDGTVRFEEGEDAHNSFRGNGAVCGNPDEWNYYTLTIKNDFITVYVNGQECAYQSISLTKGDIGLFNGGYMTKYNRPSVLTEEDLANDIRDYYRGVHTNGDLTLEAKIIDTRAYESAGYHLDNRLLMECLVDKDMEVVLGGTTTRKVVGSMGRADYDLKTGTQATGLKAYFTELTPEQVAANYAVEAEAFLK